MTDKTIDASGDMKGELFSGKMTGSTSEFFSNMGIPIHHNEAVKSRFFKNARRASIVMVDGVALVLRGAIKAAVYRRGFDAPAGAIGKSICSVTTVETDAAAHISICSNPGYSIFNAGLQTPTFASKLYRAADSENGMTVAVNPIPSPARINRMGRLAGAAEPSLFALLLCEAIGDLVLAREKADRSSRAVVKTWQEFLKIYNSYDRFDPDPSQGAPLKSAVILMADMAWASLAYRSSGVPLPEAAKRGATIKRNIFKIETADPVSVAGASAVCEEITPEFAGNLLDPYFMKGLEVIFQTSEDAPEALLAAAV